jgi:hypothetical protein
MAWPVAKASDLQMNEKFFHFFGIDVAFFNRHNYPEFASQHDGGQASCFQRRGQVEISQRCNGKLITSLLYRSLGFLWSIFDRNTQQLNTFVAMGLPKLLQLRPNDFTNGAPARPKIKHQNFVVVGMTAQIFAIEQMNLFWQSENCTSRSMRFFASFFRDHFRSGSCSSLFLATRHRLGLKQRRHSQYASGCADKCAAISIHNEKSLIEFSPHLAAQVVR